MGDCLATTDTGQREGGCCAPIRGELGPIKHNVAWAEIYIRIKWHLDPSIHFATIDMG